MSLCFHTDLALLESLGQDSATPIDPSRDKMIRLLTSGYRYGFAFSMTRPFDVVCTNTAPKTLPEHSAAPAKEAGAPKHSRGDHWKLFLIAEGRGGRSDL